MDSSKILPSLMICMCLGSSIVYATKGLIHWRKVVYWAGLAIVNFVVTF